MHRIILNLMSIVVYSLLAYPIIFLLPPLLMPIGSYDDCMACPPLDNPAFKLCKEQGLWKVYLPSWTLTCWKNITMFFIIWRYAENNSQLYFGTPSLTIRQGSVSCASNSEERRRNVTVQIRQRRRTCLWPSHVTRKPVTWYHQQ